MKKLLHKLFNIHFWKYAYGPMTYYSDTYPNDGHYQVTRICTICGRTETRQVSTIQWADVDKWREVK